MMTTSYLIDIYSISFTDDELALTEPIIGCLKISHFYPQESRMNHNVLNILIQLLNRP